MKKFEIKQKIIKFRHDVIYQLTRQLCKPYFKMIHYSYDKPRKIQGPFICLANHNTDLDSVLVAVSIKTQMYFIASENCFRKGFKSKLLSWAYGPISKIKGASDTLAVMKAIRYLKEGKNICIFPEGGRSFNGITTPVQVATGKLVKISGANLVTYKIQGGYMKIPRWGFGMRKGSWNGNFVNIYSSEQLKDMSPAQITDLINKDLYENAYETQNIKKIKYSIKNQAVGLECAVCVCPKCKTIGQIASEGNKVFCKSCGLSTTMDDYEYFDKEFPFHTVAEWDLWQEKFYGEYISSSIKFPSSSAPLLFDENVQLRTFDSNHNTVELGKGIFSLTNNSFVFKVEGKEDLILPIKDLPDASVFSRSNFNFTNNSNGLHYELYADHLFNVRKYLSGWKYLREILSKE